jgi:hypothetical protein
VAPVRALNVIAHGVGFAAGLAAHPTRVVRSNVRLDVPLQGVWKKRERKYIKPVYCARVPVYGV